MQQFQLDARSLPRFRLLNAWAVHTVAVDTDSTIQSTERRSILQKIFIRFNNFKIFR